MLLEVDSSSKSLRENYREIYEEIIEDIKKIVFDSLQKEIDYYECTVKDPVAVKFLTFAKEKISGEWESCLNLHY